MCVSKNVPQKRFDYADAWVSLLPNVLPDTSPKLTDQQKLDDFYAQKVGPPTVGLLDFMVCRKEEMSLVRKARSIGNPKERDYFIRRSLSAIVVPVKVNSRDFTMADDRLVKEYNGLILLEFPAGQDSVGLRRLLKSLPWVWCVTLSADAENILAIVPLDNKDYREHKRFSDALRREFEERGFHIQERCGNLTALMFKTYDADAWINGYCTLYRLPEKCECENVW